MEVHLRPETESRIQELAAKTGRAPADLVEDAMTGYLQELAQMREMIDTRYDDSPLCTSFLEQAQHWGEPGDRRDLPQLSLPDLEIHKVKIQS